MQDKDSRKRHFIISCIKSGVRILAGAALMVSMVYVDAGDGQWYIINDWIFGAGVLLIIAEVLGILEEL